MATATLRRPRAKKHKPPKPEARKTLPINAEYEDRAKLLLRSAMVQKGVTPDELARLLDKKLGVEISPGGVANKISRGGFGAAFLLQCMEALGMNLAPLPK